MNSKIPVYLVGPPGIGKTSICYEAANGSSEALEYLGADKLDRAVIYLPLSERDPMEIAGASYISDGVCKWANSENFERAKSEPCIVILDELTAAHRTQRVAALRYADPSSGLHTDTLVVATGNSPEYAAGAGDPLTAPEISRFRIIAQDASRAVRWMCGQPGEVGRVGAFLRSHPNAALASPEVMQNNVDNQEQFSTPRGWTRAAQSGLDIDKWPSIVGDEGPAQYFTWITNSDLPNPVDILEGKGLDVPKRPDAALATATAVVETLGVDSANDDWIGNAIAWFDIASKSHAGVISCEADILAIRYQQHCYSAAKSGLLSKWAKMQDLIIGKPNA